MSVQGCSGIHVFVYAICKYHVIVFNWLISFLCAAHLSFLHFVLCLVTMTHVVWSTSDIYRILQEIIELLVCIVAFSLESTQTHLCV